MAMQSIGSSSSNDACYRYRVPKILTEFDGPGKCKRTKVLNMVEIAQAINRPPLYITHYFGNELRTLSEFDEETGVALVYGAHDSDKLAVLLENLVKKFVKCDWCGELETKVIVSGTVQLRCTACGFVSDVDDMRDKVTTCMMQNPPGRDKKALRTEMGNLNIGSGNGRGASDRPTMLTRIENHGECIVTNVVNMVDIAKSLNRPVSYIAQYFGNELGALPKFDEKTGDVLVYGAHGTAELAGLLESFIEKFVQCHRCGNPKTKVIMGTEIQLECAACGFLSAVGPTFVIPPARTREDYLRSRLLSADRSNGIGFANARRWKEEARVEGERLRQEVERLKRVVEQTRDEARVEMERVKRELEQAKEEAVKQVQEETQKRDERWADYLEELAAATQKREERWINYLGGLAAAFTEESYSDIQVKPGNGPSIQAHKFLLATRSEVFKHMLSSSDTCAAAQIDTLRLPEFNHEELETFLEFLYCGNLSAEKFEAHYYSLALASHKYAIPHLQEFCEEHILKLLDSSNALKVLEISEICSNETLKVAALESIINHQEEIFSSPGFEEFAEQNPHLLVHIIRYSCTDF